jgi:PD-(D/E)XK endonuclease
VLTTDQKGNIAETAIVAAAVKLGIDVYRPVGEGGRYDMIFELDTDLVRVQYKWASLHGATSSRQNCGQVDGTCTCGSRRRGPTNG